MCRNIRPLNNLAPPATDAEVHDAALQYVRKIAGTRSPSRANQNAFDDAVQRITRATRDLVDSLTTAASPRSRDQLAEAAKARAATRSRVAQA